MSDYEDEPQAAQVPNYLKWEKYKKYFVLARPSPANYENDKAMCQLCSPPKPVAFNASGPSNLHKHLKVSTLHHLEVQIRY